MTRRGKETRTIQVWPGGHSFEYRGDPDGPANQRSLRAGHFQTHDRCVNSCYAETWGERDDKPEGKHDRQYTGRRVYYTGPATTPNVCTSCDGHGYVKSARRNPWRKGTAEEWRTIRISLRAELYWSQNGYGCDSMLVSDLLKLEHYVAGGRSDEIRDLVQGFSYDEIRNLYADPSDWDAAQCREYAEEHGIELPDPPDCGCDNPTKVVLKGSADASCAACGGDWPLEDDDEKHLDELREACRDHAQDNPAEVYEWWRVSSWLCDQLHAIGEVTIDNGYGHWWGRQGTGQSLLMDGTLQQVAAQFERGDGE